MEYVSIIGSDQFRLLSISLVIVIGTKFQLYLLTLLYSFCSLFVNILKINLRESRPYWKSASLHGYDCAYDFGFPADHLITTIPFTFFLWEVIYERLNFNLLVNAKYFKLIGNAICLLISLSIGFSRFVLGLSYLDQFMQGLLIGFAIWFAFMKFIDFPVLKYYLETKIVYSKKSKRLFIFLYNLFYFIFLLNFLLVLKTQNVEIDEVSLMRNIQICGKKIYALQPVFASLLDSAKFYCFFVIVFVEIIQKDDSGIKKLKEVFKINESNKTIFYNLCLNYYSSIRLKIGILRSDKSLISYKSTQTITDEVKSNKAEFEFAKFLFIFVIFLAFAFIRQALHLMNSYVFYDNLITKYYFYELLSYFVIGLLAININKKIDKYF